MKRENWKKGENNVCPLELNITGQITKKWLENRILTPNFSGYWHTYVFVFVIAENSTNCYALLLMLSACYFLSHYTGKNTVLACKIHSFFQFAFITSPFFMGNGDESYKRLPLLKTLWRVQSCQIVVKNSWFFQWAFFSCFTNLFLNV